MDSFSRSEFLQATAKGTALAAAVLAAPRALAAPSERVRHAVIGCGGQGQRHAKVCASFADCEVVAVCDVDPERRAQTAAALPNSDAVRQCEDYRQVLEDRSIDSVSIATPDHWHTPIALAALAAGKHVYVEKPCSHTVREGELLAAAMEARGKCVQHGTQWRSNPGLHAGIALMRAATLGKVRVAKAINHQLRPAIGRAAESEPPHGVNYDLWLGPAPLRPFTQNRWHYNWHWHWDYGGGDIVNDGIHQIDVARAGLGAGLPVAVSGCGAQLFYDDDHETPDTQTIVFEYPECHLIYEMRLWTDYPMEGHTNGVVFYGDNGTLHIGSEGTILRLKGEPDKVLGERVDIRDHMRNYLDCVIAGTPDKLNAPINECFRSATLCNLGNIATRTGKRIVLGQEDEQVKALFDKPYREGYGLASVG